MRFSPAAERARPVVQALVDTLSESVVDHVPGNGVTEVYPKRRRAREEGHRGSWLRLSVQP